jgi:Mannosylglycerate hydrolase MGH1-like glycoside hydrolase domain
LIARVAGSGERISTYEIADDQLPAGSTLGAPKAVVTIKATGAIEKFYSIDAGLSAIGSVMLQHWDERSRIRLLGMPGQFAIHPARQEHVFELANGVLVREQIFVLNGKPEGRKVDPPAAYFTVVLKNESGQRVQIGTYASAQLRGNTSHDVTTAYSRRNRAIVAWNRSSPQFVRLFGSSVEPTSYQTTTDVGKAGAIRFPGDLPGEVEKKPGDPLGILHFSHLLAPGEYAKFTLLLTFSLEGRRNAERVYRSCPSAGAALKRTEGHYEDVLRLAVVVTPDREVNRGVMWAKANMLRTQLLAPTGWAFVNDPTRSNNSVARDTSWFAFGADYVTPGFARESLLWYATHLKRNGMVVEYYDVRNGKAEDYGLNVNDNTPLLILALWHHYNTTGDRPFLRRVYRSALRAARHILSQRNERGLVWCTADGTANWGIVGWRNVIQNYRLSGATTELNSECYAALRTVSHMARVLEKRADAEEFESHANALREAINRELIDPHSGLYYLNVDLNGIPRSDVTADLVFPVMFGVADEDTAARIVSRLSVPDFWSDAGIHTVPRNAVDYGPTHGYGLLGGVWAGVSFWYAFAASAFNPEFTAYALRTSFEHYSKDPLRNNTVPGQFSEWLHGETLTNQGMMLSPWFPPRYLWAAIEGAGGLDLSSGTPSVNPRLAANWKWMGVRNVPLRGKRFSWFVVRQPEPKMYATFGFDQAAPYEAYDEDVSDSAEAAGDAATVIALRRRDRLCVLLANTADRSTMTGLAFRRLRTGSYAARGFNSLRGHWLDLPPIGAERLRRGLAVQLDAKGFCVLELRRQKRADS